ncbi:MAG TPA: protein-disulfide reductase DsbD domain-containing protein [Alphaproteobacteria bacterium]|nr:protein-disulfide reductase DsbD domain-containing protein [Alphaproteobacteria bacterium]
MTASPTLAQPTLTQWHPIAAVTAGALAALVALVVAPAAPRAGASDWVVNTHSKVRLIAAASGVGTQREIRLGLQFELKKNWKVYWRSPGDAGFPPRIDWAGSRNLSDATIAWPAPRRFSVLGFNTAGYKDAVVFPLTARLSEPGKAAQLVAKVDYLACDDICVPYTVRLTLALPAGPAMTTRLAYQIDRARALVPTDEAVSGIKVERIAVRERPVGSTLTVIARSAKPFTAPDLFVEGPPRLEFGKPVVAMSEGGRVARLTLTVRKVGKTAPKATGALLTLTLTDGAGTNSARAVERIGVAEAAKGPPPAAGRSFLVVLLLALLGGLILNLMPCVLPVLSIKLLNMVGHGGAERKIVRKRFLATAAGVLASFMVLAGAMVGLKSVGASVGWGIQFQQGWFLIAMAVIVTLFAANLWGLFEIGLPQTIADRAAAAGGMPGRSGGLKGEFATGAFATLLATPCSAPFLGTAVGFALSRGTLEIFAVFLALGVGLALPYLLVAAIPTLATRMPRPGRWMVWLRAVLGVALAATAVWLLTVLAVQTGERGAWLIGAVLAALVALLWLRGRIGERLRPVVLASLAILVALSFALPSLLPAREATIAQSSGKWQRFDQASIAELVRSGKVVFVDVTADWCITCKANKRLVLGREPVASMLDGRRVVPMIADWTRPSTLISRYLAEHGRYGIPFNIVYGPNAPDGIALPELLTRSAVLDAIAKARGVAEAKR